MQLTKKDFIRYLNCEKSFWVYKKNTENYPDGEFTIFIEKLIREWKEVDYYFQKLLRVSRNNTIEFGKTFQVGDYLFAVVNAFEEDIEGKTCLYEVKSSTSIKKDIKHDHLKDACFQMIVAERSGQKIDKVIIAYLNSDYVRDGDISPDDLLKSEDVTDKVRAIEKETSDEIDNALHLLSQEDINRDGCSCIYKSRANHCDTFKYFNPNVPELSIYNLPRLSDKKRHELIASDMIDLHDVPADYKLTDNQKPVLLATHAGVPQVDKTAIANMLSDYQFPLYFFDYETYPSAIPIIDGLCPHQHLPVQYSLHVLQEDGALTHTEFLQEDARLPLNLIEQMETDFGNVGSVVSWYASFEKTRNKEMAQLFPQKADFLNDINERMVDLMDIFKQAYVDAHFGGSTSIKKVLPVICPHLGYDDFAVQSGTDAIDIWEKMISSSPKEAKKLAADLLEYCKLDTFAMVEIYRFLKAL